MMAEDFEIKNYMRELIFTYNKIRGKCKNEFSEEFWDAVVLSSSDQSQQTAYEKQITRKQRCFAVPLGVPFHVFSDPPNCKIGCGGSTMLILEKLLQMHGKKFWDMRILFIPAGGYSQRLPSHSILGKLFAPVPIGNSAYEMIDLILAVYLPFLKRMKPGVFLASSDAIISFCLSEEDDWSFNCPGFTALAHPSTIEIAQNHGVYVLPHPHLKRDTFMSPCKQVLQKPSKTLMEQKGAIVKDTDGEEKDIVFTDSAFFFDMDIAMKLINFFQKIKPLQCELSSYGDFLQPLGMADENNYTETDNSELSKLRIQLYELLHGIPLHVIVLKKSAFYHFGTMKEYCDNYFMNSCFCSHFSCENFVSSAIFGVKRYTSANIKGTILCSVLHPACIINHNSVVEYCDFCVPVKVPSSCIVSNCKISSCLFDKPLEIPSNLLFHTISLKQGYVTVCFSLNEDIKKSCKLDDVWNLSFLNLKLKNSPYVFSNNLFSESENEYVSLWYAKLFPVCDSMEESFLCTLSIAYNILGLHNISNLPESNNCAFISMSEILKCKNEDEQLIYREKVRTKIFNSSMVASEFSSEKL